MPLLAAAAVPDRLPRPSRQRQSVGHRERLPLTVFVFLLSLFTPLRLQLGSLTLSPSRLLLISVFLPLLWKWLGSNTLRGKGADAFILAHAGWAALALAVVHGFDRIEALGIYVIEVTGCYMIGRMLITTPEQFARVCKLLLLLAATTIPFALVELLTGHNVINEILGPLTFPGANAETRLGGLYRAYSVFGHPILHGLATGCLSSVAWYVVGYDRTFLVKTAIALIPAFAGFLSLSTAAFTLTALQLSLITWDTLTTKIARRWLLLSLCVAAMYIALDFLSNRTPIELFVAYFSLDFQSAYTRIIQFDIASQVIRDNWLFGIGLNDWPRPAWLDNPSLDNFWLVVAVRYGFVGFLLLLTAYLWVLKDIIFALVADRTVASYRIGYAILVITFGISIYTVHLWDEAFYIFLFFLGARTWIRADTARPYAGIAAKHLVYGSTKRRKDGTSPVKTQFFPGDVS